MAKCLVCHEEYKTKEMIKVENRKYVCSESCLDKYSVYGETKTPRQELLDYVGEAWEDISYPMIATQIKQMQDNYKFKIEGMLLTLKYCFEIENKSSETMYGFKYMVERYYEEAKAFYVDSLEKKKVLESLEEEQVIICKANDKERKLNKFKANVRGVME